MKSGKHERNPRNRNTKSRKNQNAWWKGNLQIPENPESWHHQTRGDKRKKIQKYTSGERETKLYNWNLLKGITTWAVLLVRHSGIFLKWMWEELQKIDNKTRKLMMMHKAFHNRDDVDRLYVSRNEGRGFASIQDSVNASIQRLEDYIKSA